MLLVAGLLSVILQLISDQVDHIRWQASYIAFRVTSVVVNW